MFPKCSHLSVILGHFEGELTQGNFSLHSPPSFFLIFRLKRACDPWVTKVILDVESMEELKAGLLGSRRW